MVASRCEFSHIEYYEGSLRDTVPHETAVAFSNIHELDYRHKKLLDISPYVANRAELPSEPMTSPDIAEHINIDLLKQVEEDVGNAEQINNTDPMPALSGR